MRIKKKSVQIFKNNLRWHALVLLDKIEEQNKFSHQLIADFLERSQLSQRDKDLLVRIVYGVIQRKISLNYLLAPYIEGKKIEAWLLTLLRISIYQLEFLDRIPNHAIVNESVAIAKTNGHQGVANLINGVLRNYLRNKEYIKSEKEDAEKAISIKYSISQWLVDYFKEKLSQPELDAFLSSLLDIPKLSVRINPKKGTRPAIMKQLAGENISAQESSISSLGIIIESGDVFETELFKEGYLTVQDESSMLVGEVGLIQGQETILDACSAPGGKASHIASLLDDGHLTALDLTERKINLVQENLERMDLMDKVNLYVQDASKFIPKNGELYDIIFIDAPCSGLGLMRRKPEIKYNKSYEDIETLSQIQRELLEHLSQYVRENGYIVYSTCTLSYEENEELIQDFLDQHPQFMIDPIQGAIPDNIKTQEGFIRIWPHQYGTDGFFISRLKKIK